MPNSPFAVEADEPITSTGAPSREFGRDPAPVTRDRQSLAGLESSEPTFHVGYSAPQAPISSRRSAMTASAHGAVAVADNGLSAPGAPTSGGGAPAGSYASTGFTFSMLLACLAALVGVALQLLSKLRIRRAASPSALFVAVLERPG
jgi:hypothetical protein